MIIKSNFITLKRYIPSGMPSLDDFAIKSEKINFKVNDQILVKNEWISVDPYMRGRMTERKNYIDPFELGKPMEGGALGKIIESNNKEFKKGEYVISNFGWRDYFISSDNFLTKIDVQKFQPQTFLGPLGFTGHTAYIGLFKIGQLKKNDIVLVSSAAGSVGSIVCQIAKINGCKVIASTGSDEKVKWLEKELGVDHAFNYKKIDNLVLYLKEINPEGFDLYFDNVGGDFLEAAIYRMKNYGKIVICGRISQMNATSPSPGLKNMAHVLVKRLTIKGFLIFDHLNDKEEFYNDMTYWIKSNKLKFKETIVDGLENTPKAFIELLKGRNLGKMLVRIG
ncbi:MAG: putative NADP-dependent oxidoreductase YfmJ [Alphaproteobacteria bacterium MarineAlpha5_Bin9]|nr:MAG: putative NADP-dependent oxidoreductase YfmJ [Alphaproteobacteria bacterium MarineAlpha5_Bin9]|tara:strand:+ start:5275 stop:6285 length:1011 start_codon:yes stop_codon:yes gene_type:complete